jgi:hypothetical protein
MKVYRIWIAYKSKTNINTLIPYKRRRFVFHNDEECENYIRNRIKNVIKDVWHFSSASYAILTENDTYIIGRIVE